MTMPSRKVKTMIRDLFFVPVRAWGQLQARNYDINNTILLSCVPRGGSTWLAEILQTIPRYVGIWEPFHASFNPDALRQGFSSSTYLPIGKVDPARSKYIYDLISGRGLSPRLISASNFNLEQLVSFQGYFIKLIRGNLILPWLLDQYPIPTIYVVRHPCAVVNSQIQHPSWWKNVKSGGTVTVPDGVENDYPHLVEVAKSVTSVVEKLAFMWAVQTFIPMNMPKPHPWYLVTYEKFVEDGYNELQHMFNYLNKPVPEAAYKQLRIPSKSTLDKSDFAQGKGALIGWQNNLTSEQISQILRVCHDVGVDFYTDDLYPDYSKLGINR